MDASGREPVETWFLPVARAAAGELAGQVARLARSPLVDALLRAWSGAVAVLNDRRQIVALNAVYLSDMGIEDPAQALGLRPGESIECVHARELPGGCGTSRACATCGAAISIVASAASGRAEERDCVLSVRRAGAQVDLDLMVRAWPVAIEGERFTVLALHDVTVDRRRAALERAYFHDLANLVAGLSGACEMLLDADPAEARAAAQDTRTLTERLVREVQVQRALAAASPGSITLNVERLHVEQLVEQMRRLFARHPAAEGKQLLVVGLDGAGALETDGFMLHRVVTNLLVNAFEATPAGGAVRLSVDVSGGADGAGEAIFQVWSEAAIPPAVQPRIFQRYFSTKDGEGRGQGTYVIKLFGEGALGGRVTFWSAPGVGTTFELRLPRKLRAAGAAVH
jgi:signal transduction histidine kinase